MAIGCTNEKLTLDQIRLSEFSFVELYSLPRQSEPYRGVDPWFTFGGVAPRTPGLTPLESEFTEKITRRFVNSSLVNESSSTQLTPLEKI